MVSTKTVAIVVPALTRGGGVPEVAQFLCGAIDESSLFESRLFSVPASSRDPASVRIRAPTTWLRGPEVVESSWEGREYEHVGAVLAELEFRRYQPRSPLTHRLRQCDLVQVVAGTPAWGLVAADAGRPVALQVATLAPVERKERFRHERGLIGLWRRLMTTVTARLDQHGIRIADRLFVENAWMQRVVAESTDPAKVVRAYPGVDTDFFRPGRSGGQAGPGYLLSVGRFKDRRKNVRLLFKSYALLGEYCESLPELVLAGMSGPTAGDWKLARELGIRDRIRYDGRVDRARLAELYREASIFVLSSSEEGLGLVLLEAMASGLPVVATATAGAREVVKEEITGFVTPLAQARPFAEAVGRLLVKRDLRQEMGRRARLRAQKQFSHKVTARRFLDEYRSMLGAERVLADSG